MGVGWNQGFAFDKHKLSRVHRVISQSDQPKTIKQWKEEEEMPMGPNSVEGHISYLKHLGIYDTEERKLTPLGKLIADRDPGWRMKGTFFLLYFNIVRNENATVWYYMSNIFLPRNKIFTKKEASYSLGRYMTGKEMSEKNAKKDLNLYLRSVTELNAFGGLKLIRESNTVEGKKYMRKIPSSIPPLVLAYCLYVQRRESLNKDNSIRMGRLLRQDKGVGKAFNLYESESDFLSMINTLKRKDIASYTNTADLNDVEFIGSPGQPIDYAKKFYSE